MNNKKNDLFADLLNQNSTKSQNSDIPLNQLGNQPKNPFKNTQNTQNNLLDLDFLDSYVSSPKETSPKPQNSSGNLLDDFGFDSLLINKDSPQQNSEEHKIISPSRDQQSEQQPIPTLSQRDHSLAELLDMGFTIESANLALDSTSDGQDLNMAISYLMSNAPTTKTNSINNTHLYNQSNDFSSELFNKASSLFNSGKKKLQKEFNSYMTSNQKPSNGIPAWMEKAEVYKSHQNTIVTNDEPSNEIDREQIMKTMDSPNQKQKVELSQKSLLDDFDFNSPTPTSISTHSIPKSNPSSQSILVNHRRHRKQHQGEMPTTNGNNISAKYSWNIPELSSNQSLKLSSLREKAGKSFQLGDYPLTIELYQLLIQNIPNGHPLQIMFYSNLALVYSKLGNPKEQFNSSVFGLDLICSFTEQNPNISELAKLEIEPGKNLKSFWIKLLTKKAESLESLEKWNDAKLLYDELISLGESTKSILDRKSHCIKALSPKKTTVPPVTPKKQIPQLQQQTKVQQEAVNKIRRDNIINAQTDAKKVQYHDQTQNALDSWRSGNENNIRALICSLDKILWPELNWKPISLTDLVLDKKVKIQYMKAVAKVHPDKIPQGTSIERKMIAEGVFVTLNQAWESWKNSK